ncbi:MAG: hypothetical protein AAFV29_10305, partial [Myxococcota bacterium]
NGGQIDNALETYQAAASIYSHNGEIRPALALHKLLVYIDPSRIDLARKGAVFAARHGEHTEARSMIERSVSALEQAHRQGDAIELLQRFTEDAGPDPKLTSILHRLEATWAKPQADEDAAWTEMIDEAVAAQEDVLNAIPEPGPEASDLHPWSDSLDLLGTQTRASDDLYPDTTELMQPSTYDLRAPVVEAEQLPSSETPFEDPIEAFTAELEAIERAAAIDQGDNAKTTATELKGLRGSESDPPTEFEQEDTVRRTRRPRFDGGMLELKGIAPTADETTLEPIAVERNGDASPFTFPTLDRSEPPKADDVLQMVIDPEGAPSALHDGEFQGSAWLPTSKTEEEGPFDTKTEEVDISMIPAMVELQSHALETVEIPLQNGGSLGIDSLALPPPQWATPVKAPPAPIDNRGSVYELRDCIDLLGELHATGSSGILSSPTVQLVFAYGQPAAISGDRAIHDLIGRAHHGRPVPLEALPDDVEVTRTPVALAQHLVAQGVMSEAESTAVLHNQLEYGLRSWLTHRGKWMFEASDSPRDGLIPGLPDIRATLIDLLDDPEMDSPLDTQMIIRGGSTDLSVLSDRDRRFAALLDGRRPLADAAMMAGLTTHRATAVAIVLLGFRASVAVGHAASLRPQR